MQVLSQKILKMRLLFGTECIQQEVPCSIEYLTKNGSATLFAAIKFEQNLADIKQVKMIEKNENEWDVFSQEEQEKHETLVGDQVKEILNLANLDLRHLKKESEKTEKEIAQQKKREKLSQQKHIHTI